VDPTSVLNWEKGKTEPPVKLWPSILRFLGYDPYPQPVTLRERMLAKRRAMGWTIREAADHLGVDESTWGEWERTGKVQWERYRRLLGSFLGE
jgi:DNA-binding XRE family transcriptional regulator